jgi:peptidoglycan biosynthesis protein MviN/MurJ (putative lipid II flippase)
LGLTFNGTMLMLNRAFFSLQSNWVPTVVALGNLALNAALDIAFAGFGVWGISLSTSLVNIAGTAALLVLLRRRQGRIDFTGTARATLRILLASVPLAVTSYSVWLGLDHGVGRSLVGELLSVTGALALGLAAYLTCCRFLGIRELESLLALRRRPRAS